MTEAGRSLAMQLSEKEHEDEWEYAHALSHVTAEFWWRALIERIDSSSLEDVRRELLL